MKESSREATSGAPNRHRRRRLALVAGGLASSSTLLVAAVASASPAYLTAGHAYCYYFSTPVNGGMHLVAGGPKVITAGPSNYISGTNGKPQDTVLYFGCVDSGGNQDGSAYVGMPRFALHFANGHYTFDEHIVNPHIKRLDSATPGTITVTLTITGTAILGTSATGAIKGTVRAVAPGCLAKPLVFSYTGT